MLHLQKYLKIFLFSFALLGLNLPSKSQVPIEIAQNLEPTFFCGTYEGSPATIVKHPNLGQVPILVYQSEYFLISGHSPRSRCEEISARFQRLFIEENKTKYINENQVLSLTVSEVNGIPAICAVRSEEKCSTNNLLFTLHPNITEEEKQKILTILLDTRSGHSDRVLSDAQFGFPLHGDPTTPPPLPQPILRPTQKPIKPPLEK